MNDTLTALFKAIVLQQGDCMETFFTSDACIRWHNTNECFTLQEYIRANCEYPGNWCGEIERIEHSDQTWIVVGRVWSKGVSFHVTSFYTVEDGFIKEVDEYWGNDDVAPQWRQDKHIGTVIHS